MYVSMRRESSARRLNTPRHRAMCGSVCEPSNRIYIENRLALELSENVRAEGKIHPGIFGWSKLTHSVCNGDRIAPCAYMSWSIYRYMVPVGRVTGNADIFGVTSNDIC